MQVSQDGQICRVDSTLFYKAISNESCIRPPCMLQRSAAVQHHRQRDKAELSAHNLPTAHHHKIHQLRVATITGKGNQNSLGMRLVNVHVRGRPKCRTTPDFTKIHSLTNKLAKNMKSKAWNLLIKKNEIPFGHLQKNSLWRNYSCKYKWMYEFIWAWQNF